LWWTAQTIGNGHFPCADDAWKKSCDEDEALNYVLNTFFLLIAEGT